MTQPAEEPPKLFFRNGDGGRLWSLLSRSRAELYCVGASVTVQRNGWTDVLVQLLKESTGFDHVLTKNAMGGVGLMFGVANYASPARGLPRVGFVEFSTGDLNLGLTPLDRLPILLEELLRRMIADDTLPVIVHNWRGDFATEDKAGVRRIYDEVAVRFGVPVIENHKWVQKKFDSGEAETSLYFRDVCHSTLEGSATYAEHVHACLRQMSNEPPCSAPPGSDAPLPHGVTTFCELPAELLRANGAELSSYVYPGSGQVFPVAEFSLDQTLKFIATGRLLGVAFISGPRSGWVELKTEGTLVRRFRCFDRNSHYQRYILLPTERVLDRAVLELRVTNQDPELSLASKPHDDYKLPRLLHFVHLIGQDLQVERCG